MTFLHRLHPGRALEPGAVRADIAPKFAAPAALVALTDGAAVAWPAAAPAGSIETALPMERGVAPLAVAPMAATPAAAPSVTPSLPVNVIQPPRPAPALPQREAGAVQAAARPPAPSAPTTSASRPVERGVQHEPVTVVTAAAAPPTSTAQVVAPAPPRAVDAAVQRSTAARPTAPQAPLRAQAVPRAVAAPAPTVVRVSIDRLDVRLPAEPAAAAAPAPRRARGAGPSLGDYLRGKSGSAR